jgi:hypothetical protein
MSNAHSKAPDVGADLLPRPPPRTDAGETGAATLSLAAECLLTVDAAARLLSTTPTALRARCRRHARRTGREVVARLGAGVVAFKFGASWRVRIASP